MRAALLLLLALAAEAEPQRVVNRVGVYPRADRRDREQAGTSGPSGPLLSILPSGASIPGGECSGTAVTGTKGEALSFSRSTSALCQKADGTYVSVASNGIRASSRPGFPALYLENAATNYVLRSRDMTVSPWTRTNVSCLKNATGIDGASNSASACAATSGGGTAYQTLSSPSSGVLSVFVKRVSGTGTLIGVRGSSSVFFNSSSCTDIITDAPANVTSSAFVRCQFAGYSSSPQVGVIFENAGDSFVFDGWQDEAYTSAETPSSPIFTTSATVTRAADVLSVTTPSGLTDTAGCIAATLWKSSSISGNGDSRVFTYNSYARTYVPSTSVVFTDGANYAIKSQSPTYGTALDIISKWSSGGISVAVNAGAPATSSYYGSFLGGSISIGGAADGSGSVTGYLGAIRMDSSTTGCAL